MQKHKIIDRVNNKQYHYVPEFHFDTIKQILSKPLYQLCTENDSIKNHFLSNNSALSVINYLLNEYKYKQDIKLPNEELPNNNKHNKNYNTFISYKEQCTIDKLREYEEQYNIKFVIIDKGLGIAIIDKIIYIKLTKTEFDKILNLIKNIYKPEEIKEKSIEFVHKFKHTLHPKGKIPNQSLTDILEDLDNIKYGYFKINPLYKAHKTDANGIHIPKIRPVISGNASPIKPILKMIDDGCKILNDAIQNIFNINDIITDSFHAISMIDDYINDD